MKKFSQNAVSLCDANKGLSAPKKSIAAKGNLLLLTFLMVAMSAFSQTTYDWDNFAPDGNFKQGAAGVRWNPGGLFDEPPYGIVQFNNNNQVNMTNNVAGPWSQFKFNFGISATSARTIGGVNSVQFFDFGGTWPFIQNQSSATHVINFPILIGTGGTFNLELVANAGNMTFGGTINNQGKNLLVYGNGAALDATNRAISLGGVVSGTGKLVVSNHGVAKLNATHTYTGNTEIDRGEIWIESAGSIASGSAIFVGNGAFVGQIAKFWISNASGGTTVSNNITTNNGNVSTRYLGGLNSSGTHTFSGNITNNSGGGLNLSALTSGGTTDFTGVISGGNAVITEGAGTVRLSGSGANTYTGPTTANGTLLVLNKSADTKAIGAALNIATGATVRTDANNQLGTGSPSLISISVTGIFNLNNTNQKVALASPSSTASVALGSGTLNIDNTGTDTYAGTISGTAGVTKTSAGVEILQNTANNFTGTTTISAGEIRLNPSANATYASPVVLSGGTLGTAGIANSRTWTSSSTLGLSSNSTIALAGIVHTLTFAASNAVSWTSPATITITGWTGGYNGTAGTGGRIFVGSSAAGLTSGQLQQIQFFNGTNYFTATILGTGEVVPTANIMFYWGGTAAQSWTAAAGIRWDITQVAPTYATNWVANRIPVFNVASSTITYVTTTNVIGLVANENVTFTAAGSLTTNGTQAPFFVASGKTLDMAAQGISTAAGTGLIKNGNGTLLSANGNLYTGGFTMNAGTVGIGGINALGSGGTLTINGGALSSTSGTTRNLAGKFTTLTVNNDFQFGNATSLAAGTGGLTFDAAIVLGSGITRTITLGNTGTYSLNGAISGTSCNLVLGATAAGVLALGGTNSYGGSTTVNGGTLRINTLGGLPSTTSVTLANTAGAILDLTGALGTFNIASLAGGGTIGGNVSIGAASTLTLTQTTNTTYGGVISATGNLVKNGAGILTLTNPANTFNGTTTIGTTSELRLNPSSTTASYASQVVLNAGALTTTGIAATTVITGGIACSLKLDANSTITLGSGDHSLKFVNSSGVTWAGSTLVIYGWAGTAGSSGTGGKIFVGTTSGGLLSGQLSKISFNGYSGTAVILSTGEIVPPVVAVTYTWTGTTSSVWQTVTNWSPNGNPSASDNVIISSPGTNTLNLTNTVSAFDFTLSGTGTFTTTNAAILNIGGTITSSTSTPPTIACGTIVNISSSASQTIPAWNYGVLNATGGDRIWVNGATTRICGNFNPGAGTYTVTGSTVEFNGTAAQAINTNAASFATLNITNTAATVTANASVTASTAVTINSSAVFAQASGTLTISNATVNVNGTLRNSTAIDIVQTAATVTVGGAGTYDHNRTGGALLTATWSVGSNCRISGSGAATAPTGLGQSFSDFTYNYAPTSNMNLNSALVSVGRDFTVNFVNDPIRLRLSSTLALTLNIGRDFIVSNGIVELVGGASNPNATTINVGRDVIVSGGTTGGSLQVASAASGVGVATLAVTGAISVTSTSIYGALVGTNGVKTAVILCGGGYTQNNSTGYAALSAASSGNCTMTISSGDFTLTSGTFYANSVSSGTTALNVNGASNTFSVNGGLLTMIQGVTAPATRPLITIAGHFVQTNGDIDFSPTYGGSLSPSGEISVAKNFSRSGTGYIRSTSSANNGLITFAGGAQAYTSSASGNFFKTNININSGSNVTLASDVVFDNTTTPVQSLTIASGGTLTCGTNLVTNPGGSGTSASVVVSSGANIFTANTAGLTTAGATGSVQTGVRSYSSVANYGFNGGVGQVTGDFSTATSPTTNMVADLSVDNSSNLTLSSSLTVNDTLKFTNGKFIIGSNDLTATAISGYAASKHVQTNSTGQLKQCVGTSCNPGAVVFPVGNSAYNPFTLTQGGASDTYGVRVVDGAVAAANDATKAVNRSWLVTEGAAGGSSLSVVAQYNTGEEGANFIAGTTPYVGFYKGSPLWVQQSATPAGSNPFTYTAGGTFSPTNLTTGTQYFAIGKDDAFLSASTTFSWNGSASSSWSNTNNWTPNGTPGAADNVLIDSTGTFMLSINSARVVTNFTLSGTGNFTTTSAGTLTIDGALISTSSATPSLDCASTVYITNGASQPIPAWNYGNLDASGGARVLASSGTIGICGAFTPGAGAYTITGSTVNYNGTGAQTVSVANYNNLTISGARGANTVTLASGTIGVNAVLSFTATGVTYSSTGNTINYSSAGAQTIVAFAAYNNLSNSGNGNRTLANGTIQIAGTYTPTSGTVTVGTSVVDFAGAAGQTIPASSYYDITNSNNANRVLASSGSVAIANTFSPGAGAYTITGSTVNFNGTGTQTVNAINYNNLTISGARSAATVTLTAGTIGVAGVFSPTATSVTFVSTGNTIDYNSAGAQTIAAFAGYNNLSNSGNGNRTLANGTIKIAAVYTPTSGSVTVGTSVVDFAGAAGQAIPATNYYSITNSSNTNRVLANSGTIDVNGTLTPGSGTFTITTSTVRFSSTTATTYALPLITTGVAGRSYNNLSFAGGGSTIWSAENLITGVAGNLTVTSGRFEVGGVNPGTFYIDGDLLINGGTLDMTSSVSSAGIVYLYGNYSISSGVHTRSGAGTGTLRIEKATGAQTISQTGGTIGGVFNLVLGQFVNNSVQFLTNVNMTDCNMIIHTTVDFGTFVLSSTTGQFSSSGTARFITANTNGINDSGATGSIQTSFRGYNSAATYIYNGSGAQSINFTVSPSSAVDSLIIQNSAASPVGVTLLVNMTINGGLVIEDGLLYLGTSFLSVANGNENAVNAGTGSFSDQQMIVTDGTGMLQRVVNTGASTLGTLWPIGDATGTLEYSPVKLTFSTHSAAEYIRYRVVDAQHPNDGSATNYISRYWLSSLAANTSTYNYTPIYTFLPADVVGSAAGLKLNRWFSPTWTEQTSNTSIVGNTITTLANVNETNASFFGDAEWTGRISPVNYTWNGSQNTTWSNALNWTPNGTPGSLDNVTISSPGTNTLNIVAAQTVTNFTLSGTGTFNMSSTGTLTATGTITNSSSATPVLDCASTVFISSTLSQTIPAWNYGFLDATGGNRILPNGGTVGICATFTRGAGAYTITGSTVDFNGPGAQTIPVVNYENLTISQNRGGAAITLAAGTINVAANFVASLSNYTSVVTGNTINFSSASAQPIPAFNYGSITNTGNGPRTWSTTGVIDVNASFTPGAGVHTITSSSFKYSSTAASSFTMTSFTTNVVARQYNNLEMGGGAFTNWSLSSGFNLGVNGNFVYSGLGAFMVTNGASVANTMTVDGTFTVSGIGTFIISNTTSAGIVGTLNVVGNSTVSNGTMTFVGASANTTAHGVFTTNNLTISAAGQVVLDAASNTAQGSATVNGNLLVTTAKIPAINLGSGTANSSNIINIKGNFTKSGIGALGFTGTFTTTAGYNFNGVGTQQINFSGANMTAGSFTVAAGSTVQLASNVTLGSNASASGFSTVGTGIIDFASFAIVAGNAANTFTLSSTGTFKTASATGVAGSLSGFTVGNCAFASGGTFEFTGTSVNTGFSTFTAITTVNAYTITWTGSTSLTLDKTMNLNVFNFTNSGLVFLGNFNITLTSAAGALTGSSFSASKMFVTDGTGILIRSVLAAGTGLPFTWPIGENTGTTDYSPVTIASISGAGINGSIGLRVIDGVQGNMSPAVSYLSRYWPMTVSGFNSGYALTGASFTYDPTNDIVVGPEGSLKVNSYSATTSAWSEYTSSVVSPAISTSAITGATMPTGGSSATYDMTGRINVPVYYQSVTSANWTATPATTWEISTDPLFVSPAASPASTAPNSANSAAIFVRNGHTMTVNTTITVDSVVVRSGGKILVTNNSFTVANGTGTDLTIDPGGIIEFASATNNSFVTLSSSTTRVNGLMKQSSTASPDVTNGGVITIGATGTYEHARNAGFIPTATWTAGSICLISGMTTNNPGGLGQSFHHFTVNTTLASSVNCSGALQTVNGNLSVTTNSATFGFRLTSGTAYTLVVGDSLKITNGFLDPASSGAGPGVVTVNGPTIVSGASSQINKTGPAAVTFNFNGDYIQNAGTFEMNSGGASNTTINFKGNVSIAGALNRTNGGTHTINFNKATGTQTFGFTATNGAGLINWNVGTGALTNTVQLLTDVALSSSAHVFTVANGTTFDMGPYILSGTNTAFTLNATGAIKLGHAGGIVTAPTLDGNVRTLTRVFPGTASYFYNGTANQFTGNALPLTLTTTGNLNIQSSPGITVTLTTAGTTTPTFNLLSGLFAAGTGLQLNITSGGTVNSSGGDWVTGATAGILNFPGSGTWTGTGNTNPYNVYTSGGVNFGSDTVTIQNNGTFRINNGGFVNTNAPFYHPNSTLQYNINSGGTYGRGLEWSTASGRGYPGNVKVSNNNTLDPSNANANAAIVLNCSGSLTVDAGSSMYMDFGGNNMQVDLNVLGSVNVNGNLSGSQTSGNDIYVGRDWTNQGTVANFFPNNRAVFLNGTLTQLITGSNAFFPAFAHLFIDKTAGGVTLARDIEVASTLNFTAANTAVIDAATFTLYVSNNATAAIVRTGSGHVNGNLRRALNTGTNTYNFTVGDASLYAPVSIAANGVTVAGSITSSTTAGEHAQIGTSGLDATKSVNRTWTLAQTGLTLTNYDPTFTFNNPADLDGGANTANFFVGRYNPTTWTFPTVGTKTATTTQATGLTGYGEFAIAECKSPTLFTVSGSGAFCGSATVSLSNSETWVTYQLQLNGVDIGSPVVGTGAVLNFTGQTASGTYTVDATNTGYPTCNNTMTGSAALVITPTVTPSVSIGASPGSNICTGTSVTFTATPTNGGGAPTYQWKKNGANVGTGITYIDAALNNNDTVRVVMTADPTVCPSPSTATSNNIIMTVVAYQTPLVSIAASPAGTICSGTDVTFTATPTFGGPTPSYQWKLNGGNVGSNSPTYNNAALITGDQVNVVMTSDYQCLLAPTATSSIITITATAAPSVDAGTNMSTCGLTAYLFANGASNSNTTGLLWTHNGLGSISGSGTLTPTYTPVAGDLGNTVIFTLTGTGNAPCTSVADLVNLVVNPLILYYLDTDGDGFGDPLSAPIAACSPPVGRVADNTDCCDSNTDINPLCEWWADLDGDGVGSFIFVSGCVSGCSGNAQTIPYYPASHGGASYLSDCNDANIAVYPGAPEICQNSIDNDCDGMIDEGCGSSINDSYTNAITINTLNPNTYYPNCLIYNGTLVNADISPQANPANVSVGAGRDIWYRFQAQSTGVQIKVVPVGFNAVIELRTAAHPVGQIDVENANGAVGGTEILNSNALVIGTTYYVAIRNFDPTNVGTFTLCVASLMPSGCSYVEPVGGFPLCNTYKANYRGATNYTFNFTGTGGAAAFPFTTTSGTTAGLISLSTPALDLRYGGDYNVRVDANYSLLNGINVADPTITILGNVASANCTGVSIIAQPSVEVKLSQRCSAVLTRSMYLIGTPVTGAGNVCGATSYTYRFTQVTNCTGLTTIGLPFEVQTLSNTPYMILALAFPTPTYPLANIGIWKVQIRPNFTYGNGVYGPAQQIQVNGTSVSMMDPADQDMIDFERSATMQMNTGIYPNPGNGALVNINITDVVSNEVFVKIVDALGRTVYTNRYAVDGGLNTTIVFEQPLASGLYMVEFIVDGVSIVERMMVGK